MGRQARAGWIGGGLALLAALCSAALLNLGAKAWAREEEPPPDLVLPLMTSALAEYYRVFEKWPRSWAEVRKEGFVQVDLHTREGRLIDPDDKKLDFAGDIRFITSARPTGQARLFSTTINKQTGNGNTFLHPPEVYRSLFNGQTFGIKNYLPAYDDIPRIKLLSMAALMRQGISNFQAVHGRIPRDWDELIDSGLGPIDRQSLNPVTLKPFAGDGSPDDLIYVVTGDAARGRQSWLLRAVDKDGNQIPFL